MNNVQTLSPSPVFNTVQSLTSGVLGYPYDPEYLARLFNQDSFQVMSLPDKITTRIIAVLNNINLYSTVNLSIDCGSLVEMVKILNRFENSDGYLHERKLRQQSEIIIPSAIKNTDFWEEISAPFQRLHFNSAFITDPLIGVGLFLLFIALMGARTKHDLSEVDWSPLIDEIFYPRVPIEGLPLRAAEVLVSIIPTSIINKKLQAKNYNLPEAETINPEE